MDTTRPRIPLHDPWLVAIWPGMGSVAAVAGSYLIDELQPEAVGSIPEREFFSVNHVDVHNGIARTGTLPRNMFFLWRDPKRQHDLLFFVGEAQPPTDRGYALCHQVLDFAEQYGVQLLGSLPLDIKIREETDSGKPTVVAEPESRITEIYREIARRTAAKLSLQAKDYAAKFPRIVIQNN